VHCNIPHQSCDLNGCAGAFNGLEKFAACTGNFVGENVLYRHHLRILPELRSERMHRCLYWKYPVRPMSGQFSQDATALRRLTLVDHLKAVT
jgi:hypothetical protein